MLARQSGCFKCHAVDKRKSGPAYTEVANKYRGDPAATAKLYEHVTSGKKVKFPDGNEEEHRIVQTTDVPAIENLIAWILAL
jgi:cytochrome c